MERERSARRGFVSLVGAGPGDPMLITRRGAELLAQADAVVYDGLVSLALLDLAPPACQRIYAGKKRTLAGAPLSQEAISGRLVELARAGLRVVRLKGGDPFVFGRGAEEGRALAEAGVPFEVVPGVTAATAVPAYAGIPLTARHLASTVAFATGHEAAGKPEQDIDWQGLAREGTVVLFMALKTAAECAERLIRAGKPATTPAAAIYWGTTASQRTVVSTLGDLGAAVERAGLVPPVLLVVGDVVSLRETLGWYERRPLFGRRILITRDHERAADLTRALADLGAEALAVPVTRIAPPAPEDARAAGEAIGRIGEFDWVVMASANAVRRVFEVLRERGLDARALARARIACVGRATAVALERHGVRADVVPARGDARGMAEAVVAAAGGTLASSRVLAPRASGGRDEGIEALRAAGATVEAVSIYRSEIADPDEPSVRHGLSRLVAGEIDAVAAFAPSQVRAVFELVGDRCAEILAGCDAVAAIGATTRGELERRGVPVSLIPHEPSADALASALAAFFDPSAHEES